jgi:glycosyltransferase involved in cell wall biosynthesis
MFSGRFYDFIKHVSVVKTMVMSRNNWICSGIVNKKGDIVLKTIIITPYWKNSNGGGVKTYITNLAKELKKKHDTSVIFMEGYDDENYHIPYNKNLFPIKSFFLLLRIKPNAIYSQGTWYCLLPGVLYKILHPNVKLIHTFHTEPSSKINYWKILFFQSMLNKCDYITFVSKSLMMKNESILKLHFSNPVITYAGVPPAKECSIRDIEEFKRKYNVKEESFVLLAIGLTALQHKADGAKLLIMAVKELVFKQKDICLVLTREGLYSNELKEFCKKANLESNVIFTGTVDDPSIPLHLCDLYVHTPLGEGGVSIALLEAMAFGKPIIATAVGGIPEAIEDGVNGLLVKPDYIQIAEKIEYLMENKEKGKILGDNAKRTAQEKFSWSSAAEIFVSMSH